MRNNIEHSIQVSIIQYLRYNNIFCFAIPNGEKREIKRFLNRKTGQVISYCPAGVRLKNEGVLAGCADIEILLLNRLIFIEIKTEKGRQSESQIEFQKKVESLGFEYYTWRSIKDAETFIKGLKND
jgi:hypothetical protein